MNIVMLTSYYDPHISGLTLYFQRLAEEYVKLGHVVTVLTAQHDKKLPKTELINNVKVIRSPYLFRLNKGMFLHRIIIDSWKPVRNSDIVHMNLPSLEALPVAILSTILRKPVVSTYVCDITLPKFIGSSLFDKIIDLNHYITLKLSKTIASFTLDFAKNSRLLKRFAKNCKEVYPIVKLNSPEKINIPDLEKSSHPRIGMATRIATDKGIEYMIEAFKIVLIKFPKARLFIAGTLNAVGEEQYLERLMPSITDLGNKIVLLGQLTPGQMPNFFKQLDVLVVASINSTEAFGMVQLEAMLEGTPVVATDLPGVRVPVQISNMGHIAKIANSSDLAEKIIKTLTDKPINNTSKLLQLFDTDNLVQQYLHIYEETIDRSN
jgi:glycosyltransferase involved in cell wall biosynthesis